MNTPLRRWLMLALVLLAYALRVSGLDRQSLWRDEVDAIYFAVRSFDEVLAMFEPGARNGPLYFLLLRPWFFLVHTSEFALRYPSVIFGTASVPLLWQVAQQLTPGVSKMEPIGQSASDRPRMTRIGRIFADKKRWASAPDVFAPLHDAVPLTAAALLVISPYMVWYGQEGKMYATITFLALLACWLWLRGVIYGGWRTWLGYWLTVTIAMYIHLLMVLILPLHFFWFLLAWPVSRRRWRGYAMALAGLTLPYLPMAWWHWGFLTRSDKLTGFAYTPVAEALRGLALYHSRGFTSTLELFWLAPIFFLFAAGVLLGVGEIADRRHAAEPPLAPLRRHALVLTWLAAPVGGILLMSLRQPVFTERYVIWVGPAALLLVALGVRVLLQNSGRYAAWVGLLLVLYFVIAWGFVNWQQKVLIIKYDLRGAAHYVYQQRDPADLLILQIPHQEWSYRYYTSDFGPAPFAGSDARLGRWVGGPYTNYGEADSVALTTVDTTLRQLTAGGGEVWVMLSEVAMWDDRHLLEQWLDDHGALEEQVDFAGVQVRKYALPGTP